MVGGVASELGGGKGIRKNTLSFSKEGSRVCLSYPCSFLKNSDGKKPALVDGTHLLPGV